MEDFEHNDSTISANLICDCRRLKTEMQNNSLMNHEHQVPEQSVAVDMQQEKTTKPQHYKHCITVSLIITCLALTLTDDSHTHKPLVEPALMTVSDAFERPYLWYF
jgi:hypothetical protein